MKYLLFFILGAATLFSCNSTEQNQKTENQETVNTENAELKSTRLEVYCFHGTRQCATCKNMKANTKETLEKYFAEELKNGTIVFSIKDVDKEENYALAEKFEASGTALMFNKVEEGKEKIMDFSDFAFEKANNKEIFMSELKSMIEENLK
jgi:hypothetical protein